MIPALPLDAQTEKSTAAKENVELYRLFFENNPMPVWVYDADSLRFLAVNDTAIKHYGYSREEFLAMTVKDIRPAEEIPALLEHFAQNAYGELPPLVWKHCTKGGTMMHVEVMSQSIVLGGRPAQLALANDVTRRMHGEETLRATLGAALDCIVTIDELGKILEFNPAAEKTFGWSRAEVIGRPLAETIIPLRYREGHLRGMAAFLETERKVITGKRIEISGLRADGAEFPLELTVNRIGTERPALFTAFMRDITERNSAVESLRAQEEQYRVLFERNPNAMWVYEREAHRILAVNEAAVTQYGYSREEFLALSPSDLRPADDEEKWDNSPSATGTASGYFGTWRHLRKDESLVLADVYSHPITFEGKPGRMLVLVDVTARKQADAALRQSEAALALAQQMAHLGSWELDLADPNDVNSNVLRWSEETYRIFGCLPNETKVTNEAFFQIVHPEDRESIAAGMAGLMRTGEPYSVDHRIIRPDGIERVVHEEATLIRDGTSKRPIKVAGTVHDITERKAAEKALQEQAELLNLAHDAILVRDLDGHIIFWNRGAERLYGWTAEEVSGRRVTDLLYEETSGYVKAQNQLLEKNAWNGEMQHLKKNGGKLVVSSHWTLVRNKRGEPASVIAINSDLTEQKKFEQQFLRAQRLESIGTLASGVAHDLNNILSPILMAVPLMRDEMTREAREKLVTLVEQSAERGSAIVKQVLTFARGVEGERLLIDPSHLIKEMAHIAEETFPRSIRIVARYSEHLGLVEGDPTQLHQILLNLALNARDAMPDGGTLTLAAENFQVDEHYASMTPHAKAGPYLLLTVTDSGEGIPQNILDKIFDPFFTTKGVGQGTGLGLSTVLGIVRNHGGFVSAQSVRGDGASFRVYLPEASGSPALEKISSPAPSGHGQVVLIVDDEPTILEVTKLILERHNYRAFCAEDGPAAFAFLAQHMEIDLVITDMMMPFLDGVAVVRSMKRMKPSLRFIASTGMGEQTRAPELQALGVNVCLTKPYDSEKLLWSLRKVLESEPPEVKELS